MSSATQARDAQIKKKMHLDHGAMVYIPLLLNLRVTIVHGSFGSGFALKTLKKQVSRWRAQVVMAGGTV